MESRLPEWVAGRRKGLWALGPEEIGSLYSALSGGLLKDYPKVGCFTG